MFSKPSSLCLNNDDTIPTKHEHPTNDITFTMAFNSAFIRAATRQYARSGSVASSTIRQQAKRSFGSTVPSSISEKEVQDLFGVWNDALATLDSETVAKRYAKNALLLPTVSDTPRNSHETIKDYFENAFLPQKPQGEILESFVQIGEDGTWAQDNGIYEFTYGTTGAKVKARYTYVYVKEDDEWKIAHHHSSQMPESVVAKGDAEYLNAEETRALFDLWNDALATLDPKKVVARYSKDAILLPTVSNTPRTTPEAIEDYFENAFLPVKPQGVIESGVIISDEPNWAKDAGIYEFTYGTTGDKVRARYSFVYVFEDGAWKIAHHHSSKMPE